MSAFRVRVPATSANLGPGFDSIGIALTKYVTLHCQEAETWSFVVPKEDEPYIPSGKDNLIYKAALFTANQKGMEDLPPLKVTMESEVPISRGLGSSSTAVVGGIEIADRLLGLGLSSFEKLEIACEIEGHPDNVAPAIYGGVMISRFDGKELDFVRFTKGLENLSWLAIIPSYHLETEKARGLLPETIPYKEAVHASGTANVLVAALAAQDWKLAGKMMRQDQWHQPYRKQLIQEFDHVDQVTAREGALGLYISGAGPTMIALFHQLEEKHCEQLAFLLKGFDVSHLKVDVDGVVTTSVSKINQT